MLSHLKVSLFNRLWSNVENNEYKLTQLADRPNVATLFQITEYILGSVRAGEAVHIAR